MSFQRFSTALFLGLALVSAASSPAQVRAGIDQDDAALGLDAPPSPLDSGGDWRGRGRTGGVVLDKHSEPLAGATVTLSRSAAGTVGPAAVKTDRRGRWSIGGIAGGVWQIRIEALDYVSASGTVQVSAEGPSPSVEVELRPLTEVPPGGLEGGMITVIGWLERANSLMDQKRYAEARELYQKARPPLPPEKRAEVSRSIARTFFLENDRAGAMRTLQAALTEAPRDEVTRQLLVSLAAETSDRERISAWLARLDAGRAEALAEELGLREQPVVRYAERAQAAQRPLEPAQADRKGAYRTFFSETSPLGGVERLAPMYQLDLAAIEAVDPEKGRYALAEESFEVYVPASYRRGEPMGLLVWISPGPQGGLWNEALARQLDAHGLIWVGANLSGNVRSKWVRLSLALDAVHNMARLYDLDPARIYVSGYSGGGRTASALAVLFPAVFRGLISVMGIDYFRPIPAADRPGTHWNPGFPPPPRAELKRVKAESRLVLFTGEHDYNRLQTKVYARELRADGFEHVTYLEVPGMSHYSGINVEWYGKALDAVDPAGAAPPG